MGRFERVDKREVGLLFRLGEKEDLNELVWACHSVGFSLLGEWSE